MRTRRYSIASRNFAFIPVFLIPEEQDPENSALTQIVDNIEAALAARLLQSLKS